MGNRFHPRVKRTREDIQQCKDCNGNGAMPNPGRPPRLMDCATCNGQGFIAHRAPYRLADGTWSDGVVRTARIEMRAFGDANPDRVRVLVCPTCFDRPGATVLRRGAAQSIDKCFPTFAEGIAFADRMARSES